MKREHLEGQQRVQSTSVIGFDDWVRRNVERNNRDTTTKTERIVASPDQRRSRFSLETRSQYETRKNPQGIVPTLLNTIKAISDLELDCRYDVFHDKMIVNGHSLPTIEGIDDVCLVLRSSIASKFGFEPTQEMVFAAVRRRCLEHQFDPVVDYLSGVPWTTFDGSTRMLPVYFKAEDNPLNRAIGRKMMVAAVRRIMKPGCKFDYIVAMHMRAEQGKKKSTSVEVLAGSDNFSDAGDTGL